MACRVSFVGAVRYFEGLIRLTGKTVRRLLQTCFVLILLGVAVVPSLAARLSRNDLASMPHEQMVRAVVLVGDRPDPAWFEQLVEGLPRYDRSAVVWQALIDWTDPQMAPLLGEFDRLSATGEVGRVRPLRLVGGIALETTPATLLDLMDRPEVRGLLDDRVRRLEEEEWRGEESSDPQTAATDEITWSVEHIGAPQVWAEGINGSGILIACIDTGVNWQHHDLRNRMWDGGEEFPYHGYDFFDDDLDPMDTAGHGSLVAGILVGDGTRGTQTGVAPGAQVMCLRVRSTLASGTVSDTWAAQDFALEHGADVTSMSLGWGSPGEEDREIWRNNYSLLNAAGIVNVKSAGNRRGARIPPEAISVPGDVPSPWRNPQENSFGSRSGMITVGGIDREDNITSVSSPGPVTWQDEGPWFDFPWDHLHPGLTKPDVCAPCVEGRSTVYSDTLSYGGFLNTSMAQPHVAGTVALMLSKNPHLLPVQVDSILQTTALDRGVVGKDNDYGAGRVQAYEAVMAVPPALDAPSVTKPATTPHSFEISGVSPNPFNGSTRLTLTIYRSTPMTLTITNLLGQVVEVKHLPALAVGPQTVDLTLATQTSGIYFLAVRANDQVQLRKLMLLR